MRTAMWAPLAVAALIPAAQDRRRMIRKVGTSRIVREIGRGGMGVVYEGYQDALERGVAVKTLDARAARSGEAAERFRREGLAYARLRHEAIVSVYDLVEKDGQLFLVTELVDGVDLARVLGKGGALPPECAALIGARIATALDHVHFSGLVHRDIKPSNVMVARDGEVKLMDFGIAKSDLDDSLTTSGMFVGSPSYLAPEVIGGEEGGPAADVWALGVTLYELVTGQKPFKGPTTEALLAAIVKGRIAPLRELRPGCPRRLARIIRRCLSRNPEKRPDPHELATALESFGARKLRRIHPRARLVAMLSHRGFVEEEVALTWIELSTLHLTAAADLDEVPPARANRIWLAIAVALLLAAGSAVWFLPA